MNVMKIKDLIKVGDIFPNVTKLLQKCGFPKAKDNSKKAQIKELNCYLSYKKTGKISRGKVTNEIIITEVFDTPKERIDGRSNNSSKALYYPLLIGLVNQLNKGSYSKNQVYKEMGFDEELMNQFNTPNKEIPQEIIDYNYHLKACLENAIKSTCKMIQKDNSSYDEYKCIILWSDNEWDYRDTFTKGCEAYSHYEELQVESAIETLENNNIKTDKLKGKKSYQLEYKLRELPIENIFKEYRELLTKNVIKEFDYNKHCKGFIFPNDNSNNYDDESGFAYRHSTVCNMTLWKEKKEFISLIENKMKQWISKQKNPTVALVKHHKKMFKLQFTNEDEYFDYLDRKV